MFLRFLISSNLWYIFFSPPTAITAASQEGFERMLGRLEGFVHDNQLCLCITQQAFERLNSCFADSREAASILSDMLEVIPVNSHHIQQAQLLSWQDWDFAVEYVVACAEGIPILISSYVPENHIVNASEVLSVGQPLPKVYSPNQILTLLNISEWAPLLEPLYRTEVYSLKDVLQQIEEWTARPQSRTICTATTRLLMEIHHNRELEGDLFDIVTPSSQWLT